MTDDELVQAIGAAYRAVHFEGDGLDHTVAERLNLNRTDARCLDLLDQHGGSLTAGRLSELSGLTTGATTKAIDRLAADGFVRRERPADDRRIVVVTADPVRRRQLVDLYEPLASVTRTYLAQREPAELETLLRYLEFIRDETAAYRARLAE